MLACSGKEAANDNSNAETSTADRSTSVSQEKSPAVGSTDSALGGISNNGMPKVEMLDDDEPIMEGGLEADMEADLDGMMDDMDKDLNEK